MTMNVVYIKHFENGKKYVGITNDYNRRMRQHNIEVKNGSTKIIHNAMRKHNHYTEIVFESEDYNDVLEMERIIIQNFIDLGYSIGGDGLYNMTLGGEGTLGLSRPMSEEQKAKISLKVSGENHPLYGKHFSEESKQKMRLANSYSKEHYEVTKTKRDVFKRTCKRLGWNFNEFEEVFTNDYYVKPSGIRVKLFYYIYKGEVI